MAYEIGTASSYTDLLTKLITFLTTNATLVAAGQEWEVLQTEGAGPEYGHLLRGPGLAGVDQVHVHIYTSSTPASDIYGIGCNYFTSFNDSLSNVLQPGSGGVVGMALWNSSIPYWFIANGRRFIVIAKVSTVYSSLYAGFILPYATPTEFPYPIFTSGSHENATTHRWSQDDYEVGGFWDPSNGNAYFRHHDGASLATANYQSSSGLRQSFGDTCVWPYDMDLQLRDNEDGSFTLLPTVLHSVYSGGNVYGELDGVFFTAGFGVGSEDTITIGADTYLIVQSVNRTDRRSYAAIKLE